MLELLLDQDEAASGPPKGQSAVRAMRRPRLENPAPWQKHELFPAPPWATRSLFEEVLAGALGRTIGPDAVVAEPAAGLGHMSDVIGEYGGTVLASDIYRYPCAVALPQIVVAAFLEPNWQVCQADWIVTNPPFKLSVAFLRRALRLAREGVAFLQRMQWLEGRSRYREVYEAYPPTLVAPFSERVGMCKSEWDPRCGTATMYAWFVWMREDGRWPPPLPRWETLPMFLVPPGRRAAHTKPSDDSLALRYMPGFVPRSWKLRNRGRRSGEEPGLLVSV